LGKRKDKEIVGQQAGNKCVHGNISCIIVPLWSWRQKNPAAKTDEYAQKSYPEVSYDKFKSVIFETLLNKSSSEIFLKTKVGAVIPLE